MQRNYNRGNKNFLVYCQNVGGIKQTNTPQSPKPLSKMMKSTANFQQPSGNSLMCRLIKDREVKLGTPPSDLAPLSYSKRIQGSWKKDSLSTNTYKVSTDRMTSVENVGRKVSAERKKSSSVCTCISISEIVCEKRRRQYALRNMEVMEE